MSYRSKIILDSISSLNCRLTTVEIEFPRIVLSEFNTHRMFSRNSASSRAIPIQDMIKKVQDDPYIPVFTGKKKGMQGVDKSNDEQFQADCAWEWLNARDYAVEQVEKLEELGAHKQDVNRLLEPFLFHTVIVTATDWNNFFHQRCNSQAHPAIRTIADMMRDDYECSKPIPRQFHMPYLDEEDLDLPTAIQSIISVARCARVSYLNHDGFRDINADLRLAEKLKDNGHWSPWEHVAKAQPFHPTYVGNFFGWEQLRKNFVEENVK